MRYIELFENRDYAIAKRLFGTLSDLAQSALKHWEMAMWDKGDLSTAFEADDKIAREIYQKAEPIRQNIRQREGNTIRLYRGIDPDAKGVREDRMLFSWTSSEKIARHFAGQDMRVKQLEPITDQEIAQALARYKRTGFVRFRNHKYKRAKNPEYYDIYDRNNQYVTDGDNLEREFRRMQADYEETNAHTQNVPGRVVSKEIPVDDIVWVMMGGNANEYIVKGHAE